MAMLLMKCLECLNKMIEKYRLQTRVIYLRRYSNLHMADLVGPTNALILELMDVEFASGKLSQLNDAHVCYNCLDCYKCFGGY